MFPNPLAQSSCVIFIHFCSGADQTDELGGFAESKQRLVRFSNETVLLQRPVRFVSSLSIFLCLYCTHTESRPSADERTIQASRSSISTVATAVRDGSASIPGRTSTRPSQRTATALASSCDISFVLWRLCGRQVRRCRSLLDFVCGHGPTGRQRDNRMTKGISSGCRLQSSFSNNQFWKCTSLSFLPVPKSGKEGEPREGDARAERD